MTLVWSTGALEDLTAIRDHIAADSPDAAAGVAARVLEAVELLSEHPRIGRPGRLPDTRELVVTGAPYVVPYRVRGDTVYLLAVFHGRQRWPDRL